MKIEDFQRTFLAQYSNATKMIRLLDQYNYKIDPRLDIMEMFDKEINIMTCGSHGLDIWGKHVGADRMISVTENKWFGFRNSGFRPFNVAPFYPGRRVTSVYRLENDAFRRLIFFKGMINIMNTTGADMNEILTSYFDDGTREQPWNVYVQEIGVMQIRIVLRFALTPVERAILRTYGRLLRPGGVLLRINEVPYNVFGFRDTKFKPFNVAPFWNGGFLPFDE